MLLLNVLLLAALAYPFKDRAVRGLSRAGKPVGVLIAVPGVILLLACGFMLWFAFTSGFPATSLGSPYWEYRPLGIKRSGYHTDCTPSEFWFGPIKRQ